MIDLDVDVYAARIDVKGGRIPGFALILQTEAKAEKAFELSTSSVTEGRLPPTRLDLARAEKSSDFIFRFTALDKAEVLDIKAAGFPASEVEEFKRLISKVSYYFIVFGYHKGPELDLLDPTENVLFKGVATVDDVELCGRQTFSVPWNNLFENQLSIGTFL